MKDLELAQMCVGWFYAQACHYVDEGIDIRKQALPDIIANLERDIPEFRPPTADA